jgi:hypothetical protein
VPFVVTVYRLTGAPSSGASQVNVKLVGLTYSVATLAGVPGGPAIFGLDAELDAELPVLPVLFVTPLASTLNV